MGFSLGSLRSHSPKRLHLARLNGLDQTLVVTFRLIAAGFGLGGEGFIQYRGVATETRFIRSLALGISPVVGSRRQTYDRAVVGTRFKCKST